MVLACALATPAMAKTLTIPESDPLVNIEVPDSGWEVTKIARGVEIIAAEEGAAFGAAILAGVGAGLWPGVDEACDHLHHLLGGGGTRVAEFEVVRKHPAHEGEGCKYSGAAPPGHILRVCREPRDAMGQNGLDTPCAGVLGKRDRRGPRRHKQ